MRAAVLLLAFLPACHLPDEISTGVGQHFDYGGTGGFADDYTGQTVYVEAKWYTRPRAMLLDYSPASRLFMTELEHAHKPAAPSVVHVDQGPPAPDPVPIDGGVISGVASTATWAGSFGLIGIALIIWVWRRKATG